MTQCELSLYLFFEDFMKKTKVNSEPAIVTTRKRVIITALCFILFASFLLTNLFKLQYFSYAYYKNKVFEQVTTGTVLKARRGTIYDSKMNVLATTETKWRVFVSSRDIKSAEKETGVNYTEKIARGLSDILSISYDSLFSKINFPIYSL